MKISELLTETPFSSDLALQNESESFTSIRANVATRLTPFKRQLTVQTPFEIISEFIDEFEIPGTNIILKQSSNTIQWITIDLLIKKIIFENFLKTHSSLIKAFYSQFYVFFKSDFIILKLINAFYFFKKKKTSSSKLLNLIIFTNQIIIELSVQHSNISKSLFSEETIKILNEFYAEIIKDPLFNFPTTNDVYCLLIQNIPSREDIDYIKNMELRQKSKDVIIHRSSIDKNNSSHKEKENIKCKSNAFYVLEWSEKDIAQQLTFISALQLAVLQDKEFLGGKFMKKEKKTTSPTVVKISKRFDELILFIIQDILSYDHKPQRGKVIEKWIKIGYKCKQLNNYNDGMAIKQALSHFIVQKLKKAWKYVNKDAIQMLNEMNELYSCDGNYRKLREEIKKCVNIPHIPYLGILLRDINFYEEKGKYLENGRLINMEKIVLVQEVVHSFNKYAGNSYNYSKNDDLAFFSCLLTLKEEELEELGNQIEPKFTLYKKKKNEKRLTKVDEVFFTEH